MESLSEQVTDRIQALLLDDESKRDRSKFIYTYDVIAENCVVPFSIWPLPNFDAIHVINRKVDYGDLPYEDLNETEKGMLFEDLRQVINQYMPDKEMLCEAMDYKPCLKGECQLFEFENREVGGQHGICREFKIVFVK